MARWFERCSETTALIQSLSAARATGQDRAPKIDDIPPERIFRQSPYFIGGMIRNGQGQGYGFARSRCVAHCTFAPSIDQILTMQELL